MQLLVIDKLGNVFIAPWFALGTRASHVSIKAFRLRGYRLRISQGRLKVSG